MNMRSCLGLNGKTAKKRMKKKSLRLFLAFNIEKSKLDERMMEVCK